MKTHDFYYDLPEELIAQTPVEPRDHSRMLVVHRAGGVLEHRHFYDITDYLNPGDVLVVNNTRVIPARLIGERAGGGDGYIAVCAQRQRIGRRRKKEVEHDAKSRAEAREKNKKEKYSSYSRNFNFTCSCSLCA